MNRILRLQDDREPLVDVHRYCPDVVVRLDPGRMKREKTAYLRLSVARMLAAASERLPKGLRLVINDAWRPAFVQCRIFYDFVKKGRRRFPDLAPAELIRGVGKYVAPWRGAGVSGHMCGGAVDVRVVDARGRKIPMCSRSLSYQENALAGQPKLAGHLKRNRRLLAEAMTAAGFSNYPLEYWHWSFGDSQWAERNGKKTARYGAVADVKGMYEDEKCPCGSGKKYRRCHGG